MSLGVVRSLGSARFLHSPDEFEDFEQELIDQYALASLGAGMTDRSVANDRAALFKFIRFLARPIWTAAPDDADRYVFWLRRDRGLAKSTVKGKSAALVRFFDFLIGPPPRRHPRPH